MLDQTINALANLRVSWIERSVVDVVIDSGTTRSVPLYRGAGDSAVSGRIDMPLIA